MNTRSRFAGLVTALAAVAGLAFGLGPATVAQAADAAPDVRVGSYNIKNTLSAAHAERALDEFLPHVDVAGLQEWSGPGRSTIIHSLPAGWSYFRPAKGGPPIVYRSTLFRFVDGRSVYLAHGRDVTPVKGFRSHLGANRGTELELEYRPTGRHVVVENIHATAHVDRNGHPNMDSPERVDMLEMELLHDQRAGTRAALGNGKALFLIGDFNVDYKADAQVMNDRFPVRHFRSNGIDSMFRGHLPSGGSFGGRLIDNVWSPIHAEDQAVLYSLRLSDHKPVVGTFPLENIVAGTTPTAEPSPTATLSPTPAATATATPTGGC